MNKLAILIINRDIERQLNKDLVDNKFIFTRIASTGGYLRRKSITLLIGIKKERLKELMAILKKIAPAHESLVTADSGATLSNESGLPNLTPGTASLKVGGATLFLLPLEKIEHL